MWPMSDRHSLAIAMTSPPEAVTSLPDAPDEQLLVEALAAALRVPLRLWSEVSLRRWDLQQPGDLRRVEGVVLDYRGVILARAVIKSGLADRAWRALPALDALRREHRLPIPALHALQWERLALMEWAGGRPLSRLIFEKGGVAAAERAGAAVTALHSAPAGHFELLTLERLLRDLHPAPDALPGKLGWRGAAIASAIGAMPDPVIRHTGLCHRDLHPRQILDDGAQVRIVDLDQVGRGHPALDLANFSTYLTVRMPHHCVATERAFLTGYSTRTRSYVPGNDPTAETVYRAFTFLRLAVKACRLAEAGWERRANALLDSAYRLIGFEGSV